jgi:hypothetical protein
MANLIASGSYPYVQWQPSETSGVQHTDQEFTDGSGNSHMFRTYNADYNGTEWTTLTSGVTAAYATVQNPDGSIHYYSNYNPSTSTFEPTWTTWFGSGNNTIYNAVDFGTTAGGSASVNTAALTSMFTVMAGAAGLGGGVVWIPEYNFPVNASEDGVQVLSSSGNPGGIIVQGLGGGGQSGTNKAFNFSINDSGDAAGIFFSVSGSHTAGGQYFENLGFQWISPGYNGDTCLYFNAWNTSAQECTFTDCPTAINFQGLAQTAAHCTINYGANVTTPTNVTGILLAGIQCEISGPSEMNLGAITGATDTTFMTINGGPKNCNHNTIRNVHVYGCNYGIDYSDINGLLSNHDGTQNTVIEGCHFECWTTAINMVPQNSSGVIFNQTISNCLIYKGPNSTNGGPIVFIDSAGGAASNVGPVSLVNNVIFSNVTSSGGNTGVAQSNQYGVQIGTCEYVSIIGGQISQVGTQAGSDGTANICISGNPVSVVIDSVNLLPTYEGANAGGGTGSSGSAASEWALLISGDPTRVSVNNCVMGLVSVTGSPEFLRITNCPGYNDQNTTINTLANITTGVAYAAATQGANSGTSYYGPSFIMFKANSSGGTVAINGGTAQTLLASQVVCLTLASPYDTIEFNTHAPAAFTWTGK